MSGLQLADIALSALYGLVGAVVGGFLFGVMMGRRTASVVTIGVCIGAVVFLVALAAMGYEHGGAP